MHGMQALLTVGERSITAALHGCNASAAKVLLTSLMQSDLVAPLLVTGEAARGSAHVQECLLRLQLQKLRHQVTATSPEASSGASASDAHMHAQNVPKTSDPGSASVPMDRQNVLGDSEVHLSHAEVVSALPSDLLDAMMAPKSSNQNAGRLGHNMPLFGAPAATVTSTASRLSPFVVASTGLRPLSIPEALEELFASLSHCLQPGGPLLPSIHSPSATVAFSPYHTGIAAPSQLHSHANSTHTMRSAHSALASCAQQLFTWTMHTASHSPRWKPPWTPHLLEILRNDSMLTLVHRQLIGVVPPEATTADACTKELSTTQSTSGLRKFLGTPVGGCAPALACMVAAAVSSGRELQHAWLKFGDWVYARARQERHNRGSHPAADGVDGGGSHAGPIHLDKVCHITSDYVILPLMYRGKSI